MKFIFKNIILLFFLIAVQDICAQDLHFSQYFNAPLLVNPANTGFEPDVDWRIGVNYREQWASLINDPYKTMSVWGDAQLFNNRFDNSWVGVGGSVLQDEAGTGGLTSTKVLGSVAYHQMLGTSSLLSMGFEFGLFSQRIDLSKLTFDDQWNGKFFDMTIPNGESFVRSSASYIDLQAGLNYAIFPNDKTYFNIGVSADHINQPYETFFSNTTGNAQLDLRYTLFLNGSFKINQQWILNPNMYISKMGNAWETVLGMNANYNLSGDGSTQLIGGLYKRFNDATIPMIGFKVNGYTLTFSYDATSSALSADDQTQGAYEFSIIKSGLYGSATGKALKCPVVKF
jgi:type IX secretion system PorP/SprF family membrane protein